MSNHDVAEKVYEYLLEMKDTRFAQAFLPTASILLSGSTGWGIPEGFDSKADWDIHIILNTPLYEDYLSIYGPYHVMDDHQHRPVVFAQIRSISWLIERLQQPDTAVLYLWLYENGTWVTDNIGIGDIIKGYRRSFNDHKELIAQKHFVDFSAKRFDASSSAKRRLRCSANIYQGAMVAAALRSYCVTNGSPYPYDKWLFKQVQMLGGASLAELCEKCLLENETDRMPLLFKQLKNEMENCLMDEFGKRRWISHWWEFNEN